MSDTFSLDEKRGTDKILVLPNSIWYNPNDPLRTQSRPSSKPFSERRQEIANPDLAHELADQMIATMPHDLHAAAVAAYEASQQASAALQAAEQEYAGLNSIPTGLSVEQHSARLNRRVGLESSIAELHAANAAATAACTVALEAARRHVQLYSGDLVYDQEQRQIREMRAEAERLEQAATERQIALSKAIALVNVWVPVELAAREVGERLVPARQQSA